MSLQLGQQLGSYEITSMLGKGGMGEVYRARDSKLKREVAIKVLPDAFSGDGDRVSRFEREAEVLASLNHPNIAAIHDFQEANGSRFLVMELIEGETLADRLNRGPIPVNEAFAIALQITEALEAAHERGIIHRDLKPANIKLTPEGRVKVLDFGLAKIHETAHALSNLSNSPTLSAIQSGAGIILGTAAYMSPEQARGRPVDKRTDIWAFGCILYEMLANRQAFAGEDVTDILAAVVRAAPEWSTLPANLHPRLREVVERCLEKDVNKRFRDIGDVKVDIEKVLADPGGVFVKPMAELVQTPPRRLFPWVAATVLALVLAGGASSWLLFQPVPSRPVRRFPVTLPATQALPGGQGSLVAISPDGQTLIYRGLEGGVFRLYRRDLHQLDVAAIPGSEGAGAEPFFSADGRWLGFELGTTLMKVALAGGRPVRIGELPTGSRGASWDANDTIILGANTAGLVRVPATGGEPTPIAAPDDGRQYWYPQILPGGRAVLFTASLQEVDAGDVMILDLETGMHRILLPGGVAGQYVPTGHLVFVRNGDVWAIRFDLDRLEVVGDAAVVEQGIRVEGGGAVQMAVANDGSLVYIPGGVAYPPRTLVWVNRQGREEVINVPSRTYRYIRLSPDGPRFALEVREKESDIWTWDLARETLARLTFGGSGGPVWTPDGKRIAFNQENRIYWQAADGSGAKEPLTKDSERPMWPRAFSPDGTQLLISEGTGPRDIHGVEIKTQESGRLLGTSFEENNPELSPNGRWLAYESNESGRIEVYVRPFPDVNSGRWQISTTGGTRPVWRRDGRELFYLVGTGTLMAVPVTTAATFAAGRPEMVVQGDYVAAGVGRTYDVSADGQRFLMVKDAQPSGDAPPAQIIVVQNWFEELKRLLPGP